MLDQAFTTKNLARLLSRKHFISFNLKKSKSHYTPALSAISSDVTKGTYFKPPFATSKIGGKKILMAGSLHNDIVLRKLSDNIKRLYNIKQSDRDAIVSQIISLLCDQNPICIIKIDITDFYGSIDRDSILYKLKYDFMLSRESYDIITHFFDLSQIKMLSGLPRGLSISAVLSELLMREFDFNIKKMKGIYYYARFVDDIIIFCHSNHEDIFNKAKDMLVRKYKFQLNAKKTELGKYNCDCTRLCKCISPKGCSIKCACNSCNELCFNYLGYNFTFGKSGNTGRVTISNDKINKYKTKIIKSFLSYNSTGDYDLLLARISFLTSNCSITPIDRDRPIKTGIYYNYNRINDYQCLIDLDTFLRKTIFSKKGSLGKKLDSKLTLMQKNKLARYSFLSGHKNKIALKLDDHSATEIKRCW